MSYILEALRKAERERHLSEAPSVPEILSVQPVQRRNWLPWLAALLLLAINCVLLWHFGVNGKNNIKQQFEPSPVPGKSVEPVQKLSPKAENQTTPINAIKNPAPPSVNPVGQTGNVEVSPPPVFVKPTAKAPAMPTPNKAKQPIPPFEPQQAVASKPERTIASPAIGKTNGRPLERRIPEDEVQIIENNPKPLISKDRLASVKMMARQRVDGQEQDLVTPAPASNETPQEIKSDQHIKINVLAYSNDPEKRFAVINMVKYTRGERLPSGEILEDIQANGIVLELNGRRFLFANRWQINF